MPKWRSEYRRCDNCRSEYRPQREAQSYCSPDCRRAAAYGRERFKAGTKGRRKRRLEASDKLIGTLVAGSFRNGVFSSTGTWSYRPTNWIEKLNQRDAKESTGRTGHARGANGLSILWAVRDTAL